MRSLVVVLGCMLAVVLVWWAAGGSVGTRPEPLPGSVGRLGEVGADVATSMARAGLDPESEAMALEGSAAPPPIDDRLHGLVGEGVLELIGAARGRTPKEILAGKRKQITAAIHKIRQRLGPEDVDYLVKRFWSVDDEGFRFAMLWLFRYVHDDRVVDAVASMADDLPVVVSETLAAVATDGAVRRLAELSEKMPLEARIDARSRIARSRWPGTEDFLRDVWEAPDAAPRERMEALLAMSWRPPERVLEPVLEIALGEPRPLEGLGVDEKRYGAADLRAAAVMALMRLGERESVVKLLSEAEVRAHDEVFARIVDENLVGYTGPSLVDVLKERIARRGRVTYGEAVYLSNACGPEDLEWIRSLESLAEEPRTRTMIEAAIVRAGLKR